MTRVAAALLSAVILLLAGMAQARPGADQLAHADICERAAQQAAHESGVPPDILMALTLTETGRKMNGRVRPWAWSVNAEGAGNWYDTPESALAFVEDRVRQGRPNIDVGCFQINYRWHGQHFRSVADMFDPLANARYAARFVRELHAETGDWRAAAGAFHSRTPHFASKYLARFDQLHAMVHDSGATMMTAVRRTPPMATGQPLAGQAMGGTVPGRAVRGRAVPAGCRVSLARPRAPQPCQAAGHAQPRNGTEPATVRIDLAALDAFVARESARAAAHRLLPDDPGPGPDDVAANGWTGQTPGDLPDPLGEDAQILLAHAASAGAADPGPHPAAVGREPAMLSGAPPGTAAAGGGSLAALGQGGGPLLQLAAQPLAPLPHARSGPPPSNSSLWQLAERD